MQKSSKQSILSCIYGHGRGWVFSSKDFLSKSSREQADRSLSDLAREGKIRRIIQGLYDYPLFSTILKKTIAPDIQKVAYALARKNNWNILPDGDTALNYLGLSTQLPAKHVYLSNGPSRQFKITNRVLSFKHTNTKELNIQDPNTCLAIQAIKAKGKNNITRDFLQLLSTKFAPKELTIIKKNATSTTGWIYESIINITSNPE